MTATTKGWRQPRLLLLLLMLPAGIVLTAFLLVPLVRLAIAGAQGPDGAAAYLSILTNPRHLSVTIATLALAITVTATALAISTVAGLFLARHSFTGRSVLIAMLTFPLAFPGVVVGFLVIMLGGRQGLVATISKALTGDKLVFAYSAAGLFIGYLYFSIPRVILTVMAAAETLDPALAEAARSLGARPLRVLRDVVLPALTPGLIASGAICFATAMGAFGTAFALATDIDVLAMTIYTEFTLQANIAGAAALSLVLGLITWVSLFAARSLGGRASAAGGG
ncbi:ABC transporter permease [Tistrella bauzanensis]|nr:ABC transporter permease [Tistrella bauzanensis]